MHRAHSLTGRPSAIASSSPPLTSQRTYAGPRDNAAAVLRARSNSYADTSYNGPPLHRGTSTRADAFLTKVIVLVDEATEPGISEEDAETRRLELVRVVQGKDALDGNLSPSGNGGQAVAYAIRKRLKSDDYVAVLNTITLLDELMRTCPYFYRFIADDKFFRRLWRFVVPDYKNGMRSMIPFVSKGKPQAEMGVTGGRPEIAIRVLILIRAWAEELSVMYNGRYDPSAGFLIERYNSKRLRIKFPEVPRTELPWVCPTGIHASRDASAVYEGSSSSRKARSRSEQENGLPVTLSLSEVENTVSLFENMVDNASNVRELREDVCKELASRCKLIANNIDRLSMSMDKEEELARAVRVSEKLQKAIKVYDHALSTGELKKNVPVVEGLSGDSEDEGYDHAASSSSFHASASTDRKEHSLRDERKDGVPSSSRFRPPVASLYPIERSRSYDSHLDRERGYLASSLYGDEAGQSRSERDKNKRSPDRPSDRTADRRGEEKDHSRRNDYLVERSSSDEDIEERRSRSERALEDPDRRDSPKDQSGKKRSHGKNVRKANSTPSGGSSSRPSASKPPRNAKSRSNRPFEDGESNKERKKHASKSGNKSKHSDKRKAASSGSGDDVLVDVPTAFRDSSSESSSDEKKADAFAMLKERYTTKSSKASKSSVSSSTTEKAQSVDFSEQAQGVSRGVEQLNVNASGAQNGPSSGFPQVVPPSAGGLPFGSVVMMPNPMGMAMYGSVHPLLSQNPGLYSAYNTINPAMYYNTVNPIAYATQNPALAMGPQASVPLMPQPVMQQPQLSATQPVPQFPSPSSSNSQPAGFSPRQSSTGFSTPQQATHVQQQQPLGSTAPQQPQHPGGIPMLTPVPPPPAPAMYTTVTNAPAPPPADAPPSDAPVSSLGSGKGSQNASNVGVSGTTQVASGNLSPRSQFMVSSGTAPGTGQPLPNSALAAYQSVDFSQVARQPTLATGGDVAQLAQGQADQAAVYQAAMANAAAAYQAAASAYQSVQGMPPLQQTLSTPVMSMPVNPAPSQPLSVPASGQVAVKKESTTTE